jgi:hypothetical protein
MEGGEIEKEATKMKRFISLVCGSLVLILMFLSPGNAVQAKGQPTDDCGCPGTVITGAERNKLVANLLKSDVFKQAKIELEEEGYVWQGASMIEVRDFDEVVSSLVGYQVMIVDGAGNEEGAVFFLMDDTFEYITHAPLHIQ